MAYTKVDVNTNPIPANILVPHPFAWPSGGGGGGGGGTTVMIAPHNPVVFKALNGLVIPVASNVMTQLGSMSMHLLGDRQLTGNFFLGLSNFLTPAYESVSLHLTAFVTLDGAVPDGYNQIGFISNNETLVQPHSGDRLAKTFFTGFIQSTVGLIGDHTLDIWIQHKSEYSAGSGIWNTIGINKVRGSIYASEFDNI